MPFREEQTNEWSRWRGGVDQQLKNTADRLADLPREIIDPIISRMDQQDRENARRFDKQDPGKAAPASRRR
jgi:hypothetical protein